jgi:hypothetical protein
MPRGSVPTTGPIRRTLDYGAMVRKLWGDRWHEPEIAYRFSNGREFRDSGAYGGPYTGENGNGV